GHAQAALAPWWNLADPPEPVRLQRAVVRQFNHAFDAALADLDALVVANPRLAEAWSWMAAIAMVQADYDRARRACDALRPIASALTARSCVAAVDAATGRAGRAAQDLNDALSQAKSLPVPPKAEELVWVLTRLGEARERAGDDVAAEGAFLQALGLNLPDTYLRAAYADHLLDRQRPREVLTLLEGTAQVDVLLLRLAEAAKAVRDPRAAAWSAELQDRMAAADARGDTSHRKEQARFALMVQGDARRALPLAMANFAEQKEPADARLLLQAAVAAGDAKAAAPALAWLGRTRCEGRELNALAARARALK
ncbi:MAG: hypothetical protein ACKVQR_18145, partial [Aquabacterium sp.]